MAWAKMATINFLIQHHPWTIAGTKPNRTNLILATWGHKIWWPSQVIWSSRPGRLGPRVLPTSWVEAFHSVELSLHLRVLFASCDFFRGIATCSANLGFLVWQHFGFVGTGFPELGHFQFPMVIFFHQRSFTKKCILLSSAPHIFKRFRRHFSTSVVFIKNIRFVRYCHQQVTLKLGLEIIIICCNSFTLNNWSFVYGSYDQK